MSGRHLSSRIKPHLLILATLVALSGLANAQVTNPTFTKKFGAASIPLNQDTTVTFTITNNDNLADITQVTFTDMLPAGLTTDGGLTGDCNGTVPTASGGTISLTNATVPAGNFCQFAFKVKGIAAGTSTNPMITVTAMDEGSPVQGSTDPQPIDIVAPPVLAKAFTCSMTDTQCSVVTSTQTEIASIGGSSTLTYTITNPSGNTEALTNVALTDPFPAGIAINSTPAATTNCGGSLTAMSGTTTVLLTGASVAVGGSCTVVVDVIGTSTPGNLLCRTQTNSATINSSNGGAGNIGSASVTLVCPPSITKNFLPNAIAVNGTSTVTINLTNPNSDNFAQLTGVGFSDMLPTGVIGQSGTLTNGCPASGPLHACSVAPTFSSGTNTISLSGATIQPNTFCCMTLQVQGTVAGALVNTTGQPASKEGGMGSTASATLNVQAAPAGSKSFSPSTVVVGTSTTLTFTITNTNPTTTPTNPPLTVTLTDNFPSGLTGTPGSATPSTCGINSASIIVTSGGVSITGAQLAAGGSCVFSVTVTPTSSGDKVNNAMVCDPTAGCSNFSATLHSTPPPPPTVSKAFGGSSVMLGGSTSLTFTVTNPDTITLDNIAFTDTLPSGMTVASPNNGLMNTSCTGATITANPGSSQVSLSALTLTAGASCSFTLNVTLAAAGNECNNVPGASSTESGSAPSSSSQVCVNVVAPPTIAKSFTPNSVVTGSTSTLTFLITNPSANTVALTGVGFTDTLPGGITIANTTATGNTCTPPGTLAATTTSVTLTGATLAVSSSCTISFTVTGTSTANNCVTAMSTNGGSGAQSCAMLTVTPPPPPTITKQFTPNAIVVGGTSTLTFSIVNSNSVAVTGATFTDNLPSGIAVANPNGLNGSCFGSTITAAPGSQTISLASVTIPAKSSCTFSITVTGTSTGTFVNNVTLNTSIGSSSGTATITVNPPGCQPPAIIKTFSADNVAQGGNVTLTFTINNPNSAGVCSTLTGITFTDVLPTGNTAGTSFVVASPPNAMDSCGGTFNPASGDTTISLTGGTLTAGSSCSVSVDITAPEVNERVCDITSIITSTQGGNGFPAAACISVGPLVLPTDVFLVNYVANLTDDPTGQASVVNFTNSGSFNGVDPFGNICVNIYAFAPDEQMIACCTCQVSPNGLHSISVNDDLIINRLTPGAAPTSVVIKLLATTPIAGVCDASSPTNQTLIPGTRAWATTIHNAPDASFPVEDRRFEPGDLSQAELKHLTAFCGFIQQNGSGFGICNSCHVGALGGAKASQ